MWLRVAAVGTWMVCGLPAVVAITGGALSGRMAALWAAAFFIYGMALVLALRYRAPAPRLALGLVVVQTATAIAATYLTRGHIDAAGIDLLAGVGLMVIVAAQLPHLVAGAVAMAWIAAQTLAMTVASAHGLGIADLVMFAIGGAGFQMFASLTPALMLREAAARADLGRVNAELQATRQLLAESSRASERLRIARDLHDTIGHHLTALSLQLDIGSRLADGSAREHVARAHAITRLLLAEVRSVVSELRESTSADLVQTIRGLAAGAPAIAIHFATPQRLTLEDSAQAQSLVRCVQEIITNAARHADARNLWIRIELDEDGIVLEARDDGRGAAAVTCGNGLTGMRERFAEYAGRLEFGARPGEGFEIRGFMPRSEAVS